MEEDQSKEVDDYDDHDEEKEMDTIESSSSLPVYRSIDPRSSSSTRYPSTSTHTPTPTSTSTPLEVCRKDEWMWRQEIMEELTTMVNRVSETKQRLRHGNTPPSTTQTHTPCYYTPSTTHTPSNRVSETKQRLRHGNTPLPPLFIMTTSPPSLANILAPYISLTLLLTPINQAYDGHNNNNNNSGSSSSNNNNSNNSTITTIAAVTARSVINRNLAALDSPFA